MVESPFDEHASDQLMSVTSHRVDSALIVTVTGEVDTLTTPRLRAAVSKGLDQAASGPLIVDLSGVTFLGSPGLAALAQAATEASQRAEPLRVVVADARPVIRPIQLTGLDNVLAIYHTVDEALAG